MVFSDFIPLSFSVFLVLKQVLAGCYRSVGVIGDTRDTLVALWISHFGQFLPFSHSEVEIFPRFRCSGLLASRIRYTPCKHCFADVLRQRMEAANAGDDGVMQKSKGIPLCQSLACSIFLEW
jgi:hypothetical protein